MEVRCGRACISMASSGNTGYCNGSRLFLGEDRVGEIWEGIEDLAVEKVGELIELEIPSGSLRGFLERVEVTDDSVNLHLDQVYWNGKLAGLQGGMSGFGDFWIEEGTGLATGSLAPSFDYLMPLEMYKQLHHAKNLFFRDDVHAILDGSPIGWDAYKCLVSLIPHIELEKHFCAENGMYIEYLLQQVDEQSVCENHDLFNCSGFANHGYFEGIPSDLPFLEGESINFSCHGLNIAGKVVHRDEANGKAKLTLEDIVYQMDGSLFHPLLDYVDKSKLNKYSALQIQSSNYRLYIFNCQVNGGQLLPKGSDSVVLLKDYVAMVDVIQGAVKLFPDRPITGLFKEPITVDHFGKLCSLAKLKQAKSGYNGYMDKVDELNNILTEWGKSKAIQEPEIERGDEQLVEKPDNNTLVTFHASHARVSRSKASSAGLDY